MYLQGSLREELEDNKINKWGKQLEGVRSVLYIRRH